MCRIQHKYENGQFWSFPLLQMYLFHIDVLCALHSFTGVIAVMTVLLRLLQCSCRHAFEDNTQSNKHKFTPEYV